MSRKTGNAIASSASGPLKLQIEMVPKPLWGRNLRSTEGLGKERWDRLRRELVKAHGTSCALCGVSGTCHGHEVWDYREKEKKAGTAVLLRVEMICIDCHDIHHWGRTEALFADGAITVGRYNHLRKHFRRVNGCRQEVFDNHFRESVQLWKKRSRRRWEIDWGNYAPAVAEAKGAREAWTARNSSASARMLPPCGKPSASSLSARQLVNQSPSEGHLSVNDATVVGGTKVLTA